MASADRFREDANAEEDAAGAHRGRLLDELLQNAADAAGTEPGRVLVRLTDEALEVANTGSPLTAEGVAALSSLRASAKREGTSIGRFGVGFAAVLAVTDEPSVLSASGGIRWSRAETHLLAQAAAAHEPALAAELARRGAAVPVLRLPLPLRLDLGGTGVPDGYRTLVRLPFRDRTAAALAAGAVDRLDPTLLLVLPQLSEVRIERPDRPDRVVTCTWSTDGSSAVATLDGERWRGVETTTDVPPALLADRPVEERRRTGAAVRAFRPEHGWPPQVSRVLRAPQPTDDPLSLDVVLIAPLPVDAGRRRVVPSPLTDFLLDRCAEVLRDLAIATGDLALVPTGLPDGPVDAALRGRLLALLPDAPMLPEGRRARSALLLELDPVAEGALPDLVPVLQEVLPDLLPVESASRATAAALRALGVRRLGVPEAVEILAALDRPPRWWARLYAAMHPLLSSPAAREALGALPVPLADGRLATGARGVLLPTPEIGSVALAGIPLRLADPRALAAEGGSGAGSSRELLRAIGARDATARELLADPVLLEPDVPLESVLGLVLTAGLVAGELPDLAALLLPTDAGELEPAGDLLLPDGPLDRLAVDEAPFGRVDPDLAARWPTEVLEAVGVLRTFAVVSADDVPLVADEPVLLDLDDSDRWLEETDPGALADRFVAVRDLELVRWPDALAELATPPLRDAVLASDYTRWWLSTHAVLGGREPRDLAVPGSELAPLYAPAPLLDGVDAAFLAAIGVRSTLDAALRDPDEAWPLFDRLAHVGERAPWALARRIYTVAATALGERPEAELDDPPPRIRTPDGVRDAGDVVVLDRPDLGPLLGGRSALRVPLAVAATVARVLGLRRASELGPFTVTSPDPLTVTDAGGRPVRVAWFGEVVDPGAGPAARARATAWTSGRWDQRHRIEVRVRAEVDPSALAGLDAEEDLDDLAGGPSGTGTGAAP